MPKKLRIFLNILFYAAAVIYPVLVFYFLVILKAPVRVFSLFVIAFALIIFVAVTSKKKAKKKLIQSPGCFGLPCCLSAWGLCAL